MAAKTGAPGGARQPDSLAEYMDGVCLLLSPRLAELPRAWRPDAPSRHAWGFLAAPVNVLTNDGRCIVGILRGCDQTNNLVLEDCHERMFSPQARSHTGCCWGGRVAFPRCCGLCQHSCCADTRLPPHQSGVEQVPLGLYFVRGDNVAIVGEVDEDLDANTDLSALRAQPLRPIRH